MGTYEFGFEIRPVINVMLHTLGETRNTMWFLLYSLYYV